MASKRDFVRAFDIPVGFQGDILAAEPQALDSSPAHTIPGQWPEEHLPVEEATAPAPSDTFFTTAARFATSVTLEVFKLPSRLVESFTRQQRIRVVPIVREDGASKRRLVDAGFAPATPTRRRVSGQLSSSPDVTRNHLPSFVLESFPTPTFDSPQYAEDPQDDDIDDSLDCSMEDVGLDIPPHKPHTGSPTGSSWLPQSHRRIISPISPCSMLRKSLVMPLGGQLLRRQLRTPFTATSSLSHRPNRILAPPISHHITISDLTKMHFESSVLAMNAPAAATNASEANAQYKAELENRENRDADARAAAERSYDSPVDTINIDLSFLPDANHTNSVDTPRTPSPSPVRKRNVRWASHSTVKSFYVDERISEMLDSTLEAIRSPILEPNFDDDSDEDTENLEEVPFEDLDSDSDFDEDVDGPPLDHSLEESQLSKELLQDLEEEIKNLLTQNRSQPPPPKPLIAPLSDAERAQLEEIAIKSKHGLNETFPIIPHKITARDFGTLLPDQFNGSAKAWLNDEIVNEYLAVLVKDWNNDAGFVFKRGGPAPPYHAFSSHWYNSIKGGVKNVERWAGRACLGGKQFLDAKLVLYPICDGSHWRLLAVKPQERIIEYLDSLGWNGDKYVDKMRLYLKNELKELYKDEEWTVVEQQRSSRQLNGSDCGVFVLLNALVLIRGDDTKKVIACNGMLEARERMAITIITGRPMELDY